MTSFLNVPPPGFKRNAAGWLAVAATPQKNKVNKLKEENAELKARLDQLEAAVGDLVSKKKK